jgi:hypothetical protein
MTISEFCEQRFLRYHAVSSDTRQEYSYLAKNHMLSSYFRPGEMAVPA